MNCSFKPKIERRKVIIDLDPMCNFITLIKESKGCSTNKHKTLRIYYQSIIKILFSKSVGLLGGVCGGGRGGLDGSQFDIIIITDDIKIKLKVIDSDKKLKMDLNYAED